MKRVGLIISLVVLFLFSCGNKKSIAKSKTDNTTYNKLKIGDSAYNQSTFTVVYEGWDQDVFFKTYIDSLVMVSGRTTIPKFLLNDCFDYDNWIIWDRKHNPKSLRKKIIFSVENKNIIKILLANKDLVSDKTCEKLLEAPYGGESRPMDSQEFSNRKLLLLKLDDLNKD